MRTAIIIHGKPDPGNEEYYNPAFPSPSNNHWIPWLQKQLVMHGIPTQTPDMPRAWQPDYAVWRAEFERYDLTPQTMLVGHSCGAGFIVRWLSEHPDVRVGSVVLVAPSLGMDWSDRSFFGDFAIDPTLAARTAKLVIFVSDDDRQAIHDSVTAIRQVIPDVRVRTFTGKGHFCLETMHTTAFPELRDELIGPTVPS